MYVHTGVPRPEGAIDRPSSERCRSAVVHFGLQPHLYTSYTRTPQKYVIPQWFTSKHMRTHKLWCDMISCARPSHTDSCTLVCVCRVCVPWRCAEPKSTTRRIHCEGIFRGCNTHAHVHTIYSQHTLYPPYMAHACTQHHHTAPLNKSNSSHHSM